MIMSLWKNFLNLSIWLILCLRGEEKLSLLWQNENNILNISCDRNHNKCCQNIVEISMPEFPFLTTCFIKKNWELHTETEIMKTHSVCLEPEALSFVVTVHRNDGASGELKSILFFSLPCIMCWDSTIANWTSSYAVSICTTCLLLVMIMNDKKLHQLVAMLFSQRWSLS